METIGIIGAIYRVFRGYIGIMEKKMETTMYLGQAEEIRENVWWVWCLRSRIQCLGRRV